MLEQCASLPEYTCLLLGADFSGYTAGEQLPEQWQKALAGVDKVRTALEDADMLSEIGYIEIGTEQSYKAIVSEQDTASAGQRIRPCHQAADSTKNHQ